MPMNWGDPQDKLTQADMVAAMPKDVGVMVGKSLASAPDPKHTHTVYDIPDDDLLRRAIRNVRHKKGAPRWSGIAEAFALGSTYSMQLCARFDLDPNEIVRR